MVVRFGIAAAEFARYSGETPRQETSKQAAKQDSSWRAYSGTSERHVRVRITFLSRRDVL